MIHDAVSHRLYATVGLWKAKSSINATRPDCLISAWYGICTFASCGGLGSVEYTLWQKSGLCMYMVFTWEQLRVWQSIQGPCSIWMNTAHVCMHCIILTTHNILCYCTLLTMQCVVDSDIVFSYWEASQTCIVIVINACIEMRAYITIIV